jgi:hypothetical protein
MGEDPAIERLGSRPLTEQARDALLAAIGAGTFAGREREGAWLTILRRPWFVIDLIERAAQHGGKVEERVGTVLRSVLTGGMFGRSMGGLTRAGSRLMTTRAPWLRTSRKAHPHKNSSIRSRRTRSNSSRRTNSRTRSTARSCGDRALEAQRATAQLQGTAAAEEGGAQ